MNYRKEQRSYESNSIDRKTKRKEYETMTRRNKIRSQVFCAFLVLAISPLVAQVVTRVIFGKTSDATIIFDHSGNDIQGQPIMVNATEFIFRQNDPGPDPGPGPAPIRVLIPGIVAPGQNEFQVAAVVGEVLDGDYDGTVRVRAEGGNWSAESDVLPVTITGKKPERPTMLRKGD
jgi:hypothetical protein